MREFGDVIFADSVIDLENGTKGKKTQTIAFKTGSMNGKMIKDLLSRDIQALSLFRILGDH
jgi:hypothetical protein